MFQKDDSDPFSNPVYERQMSRHNAILRKQTPEIYVVDISSAKRMYV